MVNKELVLTIFILTGIGISGYSQTMIEQLEGKWKREDKPLFETWVQHGETLVGHVYTINNGIELLQETLIIEKFDGKWRYVAQVPNQNKGAAIPFELNESITDKLSFENPEHDFPTKIQYQILEPNKIRVDVLGPDDKGFGFYMTRVW